ncbi:MAG: V-type ATPase subunit [Candidatus Merdivicinus sp.]|jgi:V/A-type H+-transporting ATPase subunit C
MAKVSYPFAVGRIRALELKLIDAARWTRLREASREDAIRLLSEIGYGNGAPKDDPESMIRMEEEETRKVIAELSPEPVWTDLFLLPVDAHNIKAAYKGKRLEQDVSRLLMEGGTVPADLVRISVEAGEYSMLPAAFRPVLEEADSNQSLLEFSAAVDRAVFEQIRLVLHKKKNPLLSRYFTAQADFTNVLSTLRAAALKWDAEKLSLVLLPGGTIPQEAFAEALGSGQFVPTLCKGEFASAVSRVLTDYVQDGSLTDAERRFTEERTLLLNEGQDDTFSIGPIVGYWMQRENEARELRVLFARKA